jgi:hypothetical protein
MSGPIERTRGFHHPGERKADFQEVAMAAKEVKFSTDARKKMLHGVSLFICSVNAHRL